ncbi:bifunctional adenosylcobinamide kinase/adenosylcobinamide-phosphate guanylyltransferase [Selenomonas sp. oral taxon 892]|jgi:bifunctional adenosylcobalamin biosynthesis protein CobU|uniref:bifunctional adenosylcobinamide kinase/adenosylcobinamide-phosphate guanylyltransferase n=1 Tax=Selenomonas sp. oral taxon 892 TaxID=1321785 RepID=UPI0003AD0C1E|nr:bifunctional adenosylcobinamide kinase/adenosylcobinamide-phosphate guanylyltransferase [Selenomonas sp. oral taxon 892]ERJ95980.1 putative adenosylcobalamin biosynthesis protein CobU [Selenomonas sp. oral taxon 892 str. F0426]
MGKIVLVTGGVRSGKSAFAERYTAYCAAQTGTKVAYIATAQVYDEEMRQRVDLHQSRRPADWSTYEAPFHTEDAIRAAGAAHGVILFDCITMFLSNDMLQYPEEEQERDSFVLHVEKRIGALISAAQEISATTIFVTNEVGAGIVPEHRLGRLYRDMAGLANQQIACSAAEVYLVTCGIPVNIKKIAEVI